MTEFSLETMRLMIESILIDWDSLRSERQWATMEIDTKRHAYKIHYGAIHSNGMHEIAIGTRAYFLQDGKVFYHTTGHS